MSAIFLSVIIQAIAGAVGGYVVGLARRINLGSAQNAIAGAIGDAIGGQLLNDTTPTLGAVGTNDIGAVFGSAAYGAVAGAILTAIVGLIKNKTKA